MANSSFALNSGGHRRRITHSKSDKANLVFIWSETSSLTGFFHGSPAAIRSKAVVQTSTVNWFHCHPWMTAKRLLLRFQSQ